MVSVKTELETKVDELKAASGALLEWAINTEQAILSRQIITDETDDDLLSMEFRG